MSEEIVKPMVPSAYTLDMVQDFVLRHRERMLVLKAEADALALQMDAIDVRDGSSELLAGMALQAAQLKRTTCQQAIKPIKDVLNDAKKAITEQERDALQNLNMADSKLRAAVMAYQHGRDLRLKADAARIEREHQEQSTAEIAAEVEALKAEGREEEAEALQRYEPVVAPVVLAMPPKVKGASRTGRWSAKVISLMTLVKAIAAGGAPLHAVQANQKYLNKRAREAQATFNIPGCEAECKQSLTVRKTKAR